MRKLFSITALALALGGPAMADDELPEVTVDGLHRVKSATWAVVYAEPGADLSTYSQVMLLPTEVAFKKNWQRDYNRNTRSNRVGENDMERIRTKLAAEFEAVFREVLEGDDGYPLVDAAGPEVLLLRPAIIDLDVVAPANVGVGRTETYAQNAGAMTLYLEIYDSETGDLIAKGMDRKADRQSGFITWQTSVSNKQAADRILREWAQSLRTALDAAHQATKG